MPFPSCAVAVPTPNPNTSKQIRIFRFMGLLSFLPSEIGRHFVVVVIGQREIAREIDLDSVAFADGHRGHDVEELVEDLRRRLGGACSESLAHEVKTGCVERPGCSGLGNSSESADRQRYSEDAEIMVVDLIPQASVADLVESLELIEADGISVGHEHPMENDGQTCLAEGVHLFRFTQQL